MPVAPSPDPRAQRTLVRFFGGPRPEIVVLCGSTKYHEAFREQNLLLTLTGHIVLSIGCDTTSDKDLQHVVDIEAAKETLDELHLRQIDLADRVLVLNVGGYIGPSTRAEVGYATFKGKPISYLEPLNGQDPS